MNQEGRPTRKTKTGTVVSNKMQKTVVVQVERVMQHSRYSKVIKRAQKFHAHTDIDSLQIGDQVVITESRPISKMKRWRVVGKAEA